MEDPVYNDNHKGESEPNFSDSDKKLDFVQELLNQVVPRKRTLSKTYELLDEDGYFGDKTSSALQTFRESFGMAGVKTNPNDLSDK